MEAERETSNLISSDKVAGTYVYNTGGEEIGSIHDVMIDKKSGNVAYAVMSFGGFLGMGEKYHPLPWQQLTYSDTYDAYVVNLDKAVLENAPSYGSAESFDWSGHGHDIDEYYGLREPPLM